MSKVGGVVNDLYVSRVHDLCMKALQSLFLLLGLAPSFLAAREIGIARSSIPKKNNDCSQSIKSEAERKIVKIVVVFNPGHKWRDAGYGMKYHGGIGKRGVLCFGPS